MRQEVVMAQRRRRRFTAEFKQEAVRLRTLAPATPLARVRELLQYAPNRQDRLDGLVQSNDLG